MTRAIVRPTPPLTSRSRRHDLTRSVPKAEFHVRAASHLDALEDAVNGGGATGSNRRRGPALPRTQVLPQQIVHRPRLDHLHPFPSDSGFTWLTPSMLGQFLQSSRDAFVAAHNWPRGRNRVSLTVGRIGMGTSSRETRCQGKTITAHRRFVEELSPQRSSSSRHRSCTRYILPPGGKEIPERRLYIVPLLSSSFRRLTTHGLRPSRVSWQSFRPLRRHSYPLNSSSAGRSC